MPVTRSAPARREAMGGLAKGLEVLRAFSREQPTLTLSQVAAATGLTAATARRCLLTLEELGYVVRNGRAFLLRPKVLELGSAYLESMNIEAITRNFLEDMALKTGDSAALAVFDRTEIVYVARASLRTLLRLEAHVGSRFPAYPTSMGRVLLAGLSRERLKWYFDNVRLEVLTDQTITDRKRLEQIIDDTRRCGYAAVEDELAFGVVAVAVPIVDNAGRVVAALNSSGHSRKMTKAQLVRDRLPMLRETSRQISQELALVPGLSMSAQF
jgi:IclR family transcriptional regulator, pca regulon regulatory protein